MVKLFFDLETIPCDDSRREEFCEILKHKSKNSDDTDDELHHKTGLDGTLGRICCIGYLKEENTQITKGVLSGNEQEMLREFWRLAANVHRFFGHNIFDFDFPFLYKRSLILGIKPRTDLSFARYRNLPIYDTMYEWELWGREKHKLDTLARVLGLPTSKDLMDGSEVWKYFTAGRLEEICQYCMKDVELVRKVYYRMSFDPLPSDLTPLEIGLVKPEINAQVS
jgi:predicted PolB exonuclease-like 3'-5' exonuclease